MGRCGVQPSFLKPYLAFAFFDDCPLSTFPFVVCVVHYQDASKPRLLLQRESLKICGKWNSKASSYSPFLL